MLPLHAIEGLVAVNFDIVGWLRPWREDWRMIATGQAPAGAPVADWLTLLAHYLGRLAAPAEVVEGYFTPAPAYLVGFSDGMRAAWARAVHDRLVPGDLRRLQQWLSLPVSGFAQATVPLGLRTIDDLRAAARRARMIATWKIIGRIVLWIAVVFLGILEMAAIGVTVTNGWPEPTVASAVVGNLCYAVPFAGLLWFAIFDLRRATRARPTEDDRHGSDNQS